MMGVMPTLAGSSPELFVPGSGFWGFITKGRRVSVQAPFSRASLTPRRLPSQRSLLLPPVSPLFREHRMLFKVQDMSQTAFEPLEFSSCLPAVLQKLMVQKHLTLAASPHLPGRASSLLRAPLRLAEATTLVTPSSRAAQTTTTSSSQAAPARRGSFALASSAIQRETQRKGPPPESLCSRHMFREHRYLGRKEDLNVFL